MLRSIFWKPYSHLFIVGDNAGWSIDEEAKELKKIAERLAIPAHIVKRVYFNIPQVVYYTSQFALNYEKTYKAKHRILVDYFHGKPEHGESYKKCFEAFKIHSTDISRVRVSTREMENLIKSSGISPEKVMRIPIGTDTNIFTPQTPETKKISRGALDIPEDAIVVGSFLKDGDGWDEGNEPKSIKGPDVFLKVIEKLKQDIPNIWVLLSGPARGYIKNGLDKLSVPYRHRYLKDPHKLTELYNALDLYIVTSREEGGPKSCLESMAKGVPLVTTAVGQCADLVKSGVNAMMAPIDDVDKLSEYSLEILKNNKLKGQLISNGFQTAEENSYEAQLSLWRKYFKDLIIF